MSDTTRKTFAARHLDHQGAWHLRVQFFELTDFGGAEWSVLGWPPAAFAGVEPLPAGAFGVFFCLQRILSVISGSEVRSGRMSMIRVIARLDIKGANLVKGIRLEGLRVLGDPETFARHYYETGADELIYQDAVASLYGRNSLCEIISRTSREIFIPLTVGGGLRSLEDIRSALAAGADKVAINTAAIQQPELIREASRRFGSSTIVVAIEAGRQANGSWLAFTDNGREHTGVDAIEWAARAESLGAGEILATSIDREGTGEGFDTELCARIASAVRIPVIAHGGAGRPEHVAEVAQKSAVSAVAVSSILHYEAIRSLRPKSETSSEGNREFLHSGRAVSHVQSCTMPALKHNLRECGVMCRLEDAA
jgi:cyclase